MDALTWGAVVVAGGSVVALIKFWMDMGAAVARAASAEAMGTAALGRAAMVSDDLNKFKVEVARDFKDVASTNELSAAESRFTDAVHGLRDDFRAMAERLDKVLIELVKKKDL